MLQSMLGRLHLDRFDTPIGTALLVTDDDGNLRLLDWEDHEDRMRVLLRRGYGPVALGRGPAP
ncbi:MAG: methylated-DNA--protein-cysteine methyltransferase, partial [Hyphomicrobiales bacterium]|nr:methylated-DNA--protein-cysteine methyltransferase [Hyphomicrobiales bacterium]